MEINELIDELEVWRDQIHPHFKNRKYLDFVSQYIEKASSDSLSEEHDCLLGCPVCRSKNAQDLPIRIVDLTP